MEALAAIGLAGNIVQFVSFFSELISKSFEIRNSAAGCTDRVSNLGTVYEKLSAFSSKLSSCSHSIPAGSTQLDENVAAIEELSKKCKVDCDKLLKIVCNLKSDDGIKGPWKSFRKALKTFWERERIDELEKRLSGTQATLTLLICAITSQWQSIHEKELVNLQTESKRLHSEHATKLEQIKKSLNEIDSLIRAAKSSSSDGDFLPTGVSLLERKMAQLDLSKETVAKEQAILGSLSYEIRPARHESICEAHEKTFRWIFKRPNDDATHEVRFLDWLERSNGIFWISGKPGSGKSTLMKFVADNVATRRALMSWSAPKPVVIATHYFWSPGTDMQKSQKGLLQSLLYDIFRQCPDLVEPICGARWSATAKDISTYWSLSELQGVLQEVANRETLFSKFCFFIDGLDEYAGDHPDICRTLKNLAKSPHIKLCVSSRPWNAFKEAFDGNSLAKLYIHELTRGDIQRFAQSRLQEHPRWNGAIDASQRQLLVDEITERARGVFLWVFLVIRELRESLTNRDPFPDLLRRLESFPTDLEPFFRQILESVDPFYHDRMSTTLQIALAAKEPLPLSIYAFHYVEKDEPDYALHLPAKPYTADETQEIEENTAWHLNSRTRGLLEAQVTFGNVNFLHRTVVDFLRTREMSDFLATKAPTDFNPTASILKAYTAGIKTNFPSVHHTLLNHHLEEALSYAAQMEEQTRHGNTYTHKLLDELERSISKMYGGERVSLIMFGKPARDFFREHIVCAQLVDYLRIQLVKHPGYLKFLDKSLLVFLLYNKANIYHGTRERGKEMIRCLLEAGTINLNEVYHSDLLETPWSHFIADIFKCGKNFLNSIWDTLDRSLFKLLLDYGADPNASAFSTERYDSSPFSIVWVNYLRVSLHISPGTPHEYQSTYLDILDDFFNHGADLKASPHRGASIPPPERSSALEAFFDDLYRIEHAVNFPLLVQIIHKLFYRAEEAGLELLIERIRQVIEKVFPPHIRDELGTRLLEHQKRMKDSQRGKKRRICDNMDSGQAPKDGRRTKNRRRTR